MSHPWAFSTHSFAAATDRRTNFVIKPADFAMQQEATILPSSGKVDARHRRPVCVSDGFVRRGPGKNAT